MLLTYDQLPHYSKYWNYAGQKLVLCRGCFDPLHIGHIRHLKLAGKQGEWLVVAVTADPHLAKGPGRPSLPDRLRAEAIDAIAGVDYVFVDPHPNAVEAIRLLKPGVYCKGEEYSGQRTPALLAEEAALEAVGGHLVFVGEKVASSTALLKQAGTFLYLRGSPGAGKHTVARILARRLNWKLFWLHDLDGICKVVGSHQIPRLMDEVTRPILQHLLAQEQNLIYVRPSRDAETVRRVRELVACSGRRFLPVQLMAPYATLVARVAARPEGDCRIHDEAGLKEYLSARPPSCLAGEVCISTDECTPARVAYRIEELLSR